MTALVLGSTGLVGSYLLTRLASHPHWDRIVTLGRRPAAPISPRHDHHVIDFDRLAQYTDWLKADDVFCCLGTTAKQTPDEEAYRRVDYQYPLDVARIAHRLGATQYLLVSALGASPQALTFYNRTKGEVERDIRRVGYDAYQVFRPSLLTGSRDEPRAGEQLAETVLGAARPLLQGPLKNLRPTPADDVAAAMVRVAADRPRGEYRFDPEAIRRLAREPVAA